MCMAANKLKGSRAVTPYNENAAALARQHNDANILCLGGREMKEALVKKMVKKFLETPFSNDERHIRRIKEISSLEK